MSEDTGADFSDLEAIDVNERERRLRDVALESKHSIQPERGLVARLFSAERRTIESRDAKSNVDDARPSWKREDPASTVRMGSDICGRIGCEPNGFIGAAHEDTAFPMERNRAVSGGFVTNRLTVQLEEIARRERRGEWRRREDDERECDELGQHEKR